MLRPLSLALIAVAPPAWACAPMPPDPAGAAACASVSLREGWVCVGDPRAPEGYRIERLGPDSACPPLPPCERDAAGDCVPARPSPLAALLRALGF